MNASLRQQSPTPDQIVEFAELLQHRGITRDAFTRTIASPDICDKVAALMRLTDIPAIDVSPAFEERAMKRVVNYLFSRAIERTKKFDAGPWYARSSTGYDPRDLSDEFRFRKLLKGMESQCLTVLVLRNGLLDNERVPAGVIAERYGIPVSYVSTLLKRANRHMKARQATEFPFFEKRNYVYDDMYDQDMASYEHLPIGEYFSLRQYFLGQNARELTDRTLAAGVTTLGELRALPRRRAAEVLLGPDVYLPLKHFPRYVHVMS